MARKDAIGHMDCPECGFDRAEVRADKNGGLYRYCPACSAQYFTRGETTREKNLRAKMRPVPVTVTEPVTGRAPAVPVMESAPVAAPVPAAAAPAKVSRRVGLLLEDPR
jgi:hypothetical protein